jgi:hypothetical protein
MSRASFTYNGERIYGWGYSVTATESEIERETSIYSHTWDRILPTIVASTTGYTYFPMLTLVNGEPTETRPVGGSDEDDDTWTDRGGSVTTDSEERATETEEGSASETSDNAASRRKGDSHCGGLATLAMFWGVAIAVGAALMVPF